MILAGCASTPDILTPIAPRVRHVESTERYGERARLHLFLFEPAKPRPLERRVRLARTAILTDPECRWVEAPLQVLAEETAKQGARYADTLLVAPLECA